MHRHSGIGYHKPESVHYGLATAIREQHAAVLKAAYAAHQERFLRAKPQPPALPTAVDQCTNEGGEKGSVIPDPRCLFGRDRRGLATKLRRFY